jgi:hypothetical protein
MKKEDFERIARIAERGVALLAEHGVKAKRLDIIMDLEFCDEDVALDFEKLAGFDDGDFGHDIAGIYRHFNRQTKKLEDCFVPRCAVSS